MTRDAMIKGIGRDISFSRKKEMRRHKRRHTQTHSNRRRHGKKKNKSHTMVCSRDQLNHRRHPFLPETCLPSHTCCLGIDIDPYIRFVSKDQMVWRLFCLTKSVVARKGLRLAFLETKHPRKRRTKRNAWFERRRHLLRSPENLIPYGFLHFLSSTQDCCLLKTKHIMSRSSWEDNRPFFFVDPRGQEQSFQAKREESWFLIVSEHFVIVSRLVSPVI